MKIKILIAEAEEIPAWYGIAYRNPCSRFTICYPIPFNWCVRWARYIWFFLAVPKKAWFEQVNNSTDQKNLSNSYELGLANGYASGYATKTKEINEFIKQERKNSSEVRGDSDEKT